MSHRPPQNTFISGSPHNLPPFPSCCFTGISIPFFPIIFTPSHLREAGFSNPLQEGENRPIHDSKLRQNTDHPTVCPWHHIHTDLRRRQSSQLLTGCKATLATAAIPPAHPTRIIALPQNHASRPAQHPASRLFSDNTDRLYFPKFGLRMRLLPLRLLADRREFIVACCQLHRPLKASHRILPLVHQFSAA